MTNTQITTQRLPPQRLVLPTITRTYTQTFRRQSEPDGPTRRECWAATTTDGIWRIDRLEETGTPWEITHLPTGTVLPMWFGSLKKALRFIATGAAQELI